MALVWNLSRIKDADTLCWDEEQQMRPLTYTLIMSTMMAQLGEITEKNAADFHDRLNLYQRTQGALLHGPKATPYYITLADVRAHIGLTCNVPSTTRKKWNAWFKQMLYAWAVEKMIDEEEKSNERLHSAAG